MGKILESVGIIDGYDIVEIGKLKAKKDELFDEIEKYDNKVKNEIRQIVNTSSGIVFAIVKKRKIKGLYLFKVETKENSENLKHIKTVYTDEITDDVREKYDNLVLDIVKDYVSTFEYDKVTMGDKVVQIDPKKSKKERILSIIGGFVIGFIIGFIINGAMWGIVYGVIFAPIYSGLEVVVTKKRGRKRKK